MDFDWIIKGKLAAAGAPRTVEELMFWRKLGIKAVLNLLEPFEMKVREKHYREMSFDYLNIPIRDMTAPTMEDLKKAVLWIDKKIKENKPVLVHCYAGIGRTGTVVAAYLIYKGYSVDSAISHVRKRRPGSIVTFDQEISLHAFYQVLKNGGILEKA
ncbi:MAG: protein-tyrosine phosphatase family protein [Candidatus Njordarchaeia archaeon]